MAKLSLQLFTSVCSSSTCFTDGSLLSSEQLCLADCPWHIVCKCPFLLHLKQACIRNQQTPCVCPCLPQHLYTCCTAITSGSFCRVNWSVGCNNAISAAIAISSSHYSVTFFSLSNFFCMLVLLNPHNRRSRKASSKNSWNLHM